MADPAVDDTINPRLVEAEYAVRGAITERAAQIEKDLASGKHSHPFDKVLYCNIGNPQQLNQKPISYPRQLLACCECPELAGEGSPFPADVVQRAQTLGKSLKVGAYTASVGNAEVRRLVAKGISERDGHECDPDNVYISNGASAAVHAVLTTLISDEKDAFLVPIPQYPLYSAALTLNGGTMLPYYLDELHNWRIDIEEVKRAIEQAQSRGLRLRGMVVINPGNPTGQVLDVENQIELLQLAVKAGMPILADEVYQENVWATGKTFTSFRKVALDENIPATVLSMHSVSKGFFGECGQRGGYLECLNVPEKIIVQMKKLLSISLCSNTAGQLMVAAMMQPPKPGEPSFELYDKEMQAILSSMARRARLLVDGLRKLEGVTCAPPGCESQGALYAFPRLTLPPAAHAAAEKEGIAPDFLYCRELLEATGVVAVPGSGFKQAPGTLHMRLTILPPEEDMAQVIDGLAKFHASFMQKYSAEA